MSKEKMSELEEITKTLSGELHSVIHLASKGTNIAEVEAAILLQTRFIQEFVEIAVLKILTPDLEDIKNKKKIYDYVYQNFNQFKQLLQTSIAVAFDNAFKTFSGKQMDYYVEIAPFPTPVNKELI